MLSTDCDAGGAARGGESLFVNAIAFDDAAVKALLAFADGDAVALVMSMQAF